MIEARVTQAIPPEDHEDYAFGDSLREVAAGKYVLVVDEEIEGRSLRQKWADLKDWMKNPGSPADGQYHVVVEEAPFEEGDIVELDLEPSSLDDVHLGTYERHIARESA